MNVKKTKKFKENRPENYHVHDTHQASPSKLEVSSCRDGLLEDLIILGHVPVPEAIVRGVGLVHQDRRHQLP